MEESKDRHAIWWARHAVGKFERAAGYKERPASQFLAQRCQFLQVEHLSDRHTPSGKQVVVQIPFLLDGREYLKTDCVRCDGSEMVIPEESDHALALLDTRMLWRIQLTVRLLLRVRHCIPRFGEAYAEKECVSLLKLDFAFLRYLKDIIQ